MKKRKIFKAAIFVMLLLVVYLLLVAVFLTSINSRKPFFNDSDLIFSRVEVPAESNAFWTLLKATNELYWPKPLEYKLDNLSDNTNWDDSLAADVLKKNQACLDLFDESLRQPFLLIPEPKTFAEDYPYLGGWKAISRIESIRAITLYHSKNEKDAFDAALKIIQFGHRAENSGGGMIHYLVGSSIKTIGLLRLQQMTADTTLNEAELIRLIRELDNFKPNTEGFTNALKVEYQTGCKFIDDYATGKMSSTNSDEQVAISGGIKLFFNATKTKMEIAQVDRVLLDNFSKPLSEIPWSELPVEETNSSFLSFLGRMVKGNVMGDIFFELLKTPVESFATRKSREDVNVTATQLLLALKIYKMRHDKLPESLSQLVPEFFPQIPIDNFDGKPFRYLPDKKIIYSVGPDLKDSGGEPRHKGSDNYDLPFKIEF